MVEPLHFDTEAWSDYMTKIKTHVEENKGKLDILTLYVGDLTSSEWKSPAALEFKSKFDDWSNKEYRYYERLLELTQRVYREIDQWLDVASTLE